MHIHSTFYTNGRPVELVVFAPDKMMCFFKPESFNAGCFFGFALHPGNNKVFD